MRVSEAVMARRSVRGFLPTPVDGEVLRRVVEMAAWAPSGGNLQPWHIDVVGGEALEGLKRTMMAKLIAGGEPEPTEYDIYPRELPEPHRSYRHEVGEELYGRLGIPREDKAGRRMWFANNFQFFGAPVALFCSVDRRMGPPQWSDLGMYLQTLMLLLKEEGLDSCAQECWAIFPATIRSFLEMPDERMLFCGMAIGYKNPENPANLASPSRAPVGDWAVFRGL
jgi:nitroreductase